ncbi:MAG TPA: HmuY family protein [Cellvibrio sp.]|nr:HmuY family protein [Cellvibrio sp.]
MSFISVQQSKLAAVLAACLTMVACGGSDGGSSPAASSASTLASSRAPSSVALSSVTSSAASVNSSVELSSKAVSSSAPVSSSASSQASLVNVGPLNTGTTSAPVFVYYDLDTATKLTLTEAEAATNSEWDISFRRTKVYLNAKASTPVKAYPTGNNADFFDASKAPIKEKFINATPATELADFTAVTAAAIPAASAFTTDKEERVIGGKFYNYNMTTHVASAADNKYFVVFSDGNYSKIRAKSLTTAGRIMSTITLGISFQDVTRGDTTFLAEVERTIDAVACTGNVYVDLDTQTQVTANDPWDIYFPCVTVGTDTGANFELNIAADASAIADGTPSYAGIDKNNHSFYSFQPNISNVLFFDTNAWYQYNLENTHLLYSQYQVYLVKTATGTYKFQITSYYSEAGASGNYSFRYQAL